MKQHKWKEFMAKARKFLTTPHYLFAARSVPVIALSVVLILGSAMYLTAYFTGQTDTIHNVFALRNYSEETETVEPSYVPTPTPTPDPDPTGYTPGVWLVFKTRLKMTQVSSDTDATNPLEVVRILHWEDETDDKGRRP